MDKSNAAADYTQTVQEIDEILRRAELIFNRVEKFEFTSSTASAAMSDGITAMATLFAALCLGKKHGMPDHVALSLLAVVMRIHAEEAELAWRELMRRVRNEMIMQATPASSTVN